MWSGISEDFLKTSRLHETVKHAYQNEQFYYLAATIPSYASLSFALHNFKYRLPPTQPCLHTRNHASTSNHLYVFGLVTNSLSSEFRISSYLLVPNVNKNITV
jgi:hypothetical protein